MVKYILWIMYVWPCIVDYIEYRCQSLKYINAKILPFFNKYPIIGEKSKDFED